VPLGDASAPMLAAKSLSLVRGGRILFENLFLDVYPGQLWQIDGANGAGKTSLMRILCGLSVYGFEGEVQRHVPQLYLGHNAAVKSLLTPRENLLWHASGEGRFSVDLVDTALARVGLYGYEDVPSHMLSAGQHRRVNLARLYLSENPLWLLDEPFTAIDRAGVKELESLLASHVEGGGAVVMTSHQTLQVQCQVSFLSLSGGPAS
jgi:heme exporter protein A